jgi:hypothetical protein
VPDIFDEVAEDLRAERAKHLFRRYGLLVVAVVIIGLAGVGGWELWQRRQRQQDDAAAATMLAAMQLADKLPPPGLPGAMPPAPGAREAALAGFEKLDTSAPETYRTLARLRQAGLKADGGDLAGADVLWDQVAGDGSADPLLRDLASLLWVQRQPETADPAALLARLKPLTSPDNPWHPLALEQQALIQMRGNAPAGSKDAARDTLRLLAADASVPDGVRNRANGLLAKLGG